MTLFESIQILGTEVYFVLSVLHFIKYASYSKLSWLETFINQIHLSIAKKIFDMNKIKDCIGEVCVPSRTLFVYSFIALLHCIRPIHDYFHILKCHNDDD